MRIKYTWRMVASTIIKQPFERELWSDMAQEIKDLAWSLSAVLCRFLALLAAPITIPLFYFVLRHQHKKWLDQAEEMKKQWMEDI